MKHDYSIRWLMGMFAAGLGVGMLAGDFAWHLALAGAVAFFVLSVPVGVVLGWAIRALARRSASA